MSDEIDPIAQGQQVPAETATPSSNEAIDAGGQKSGIERRIAELTAARRSAEEQATGYQSQLQERDAQIAQLIQAFASNQQQAQAPREPEVEIDLETKQKLDAYVSPQLREVKKMMEQMQAVQAQQLFQQTLASVSVKDPEVAKIAQQLAADWQRRGLTGWKPEDAITYAMGQKALKASQSQTQARDELGRFNGMGSNVMAGQAVPRVEQADSSALPANFDSLPIDKQVALLEARIGDKPF